MSRALAPGSVWITAHGAQTGSAVRGIGRYVFEHIAAIHRADPALIRGVRVAEALPVPPALEALLGAERVGSEVLSDNGRPAIYHVTSPFEGLRAGEPWQALTLDELWPAAAREGGMRTVVTLHDVIPLVMRDRYLDHDPFIRAAYLSRLGLVRAADHLMANSESTAADASELLGTPEERITVIQSGVSNAISSLVQSKKESEEIVDSEVPGLRRPFLLCVGAEDPRKNLDGLLAAYGRLAPELRRRFQLVIVCELPRERSRELRRYARSQGVAKRELLLTGFVPDRILAALYRACELFVFPSLYEGAGLPVLEAMSCDAPIAASARSAIPEILGDLRATFDPVDIREMADCISRVLGDPDELDGLRERSRRRAAHYSWARVAELTLDGYETVLSRPPLRPAAG